MENKIKNINTEYFKTIIASPILIPIILDMKRKQRKNKIIVELEAFNTNINYECINICNEILYGEIGSVDLDKLKGKLRLLLKNIEKNKIYSSKNDAIDTNDLYNDSYNKRDIFLYFLYLSNKVNDVSELKNFINNNNIEKEFESKKEKVKKSLYKSDILSVEEREFFINYAYFHNDFINNFEIAEIFRNISVGNKCVSKENFEIAITGFIYNILNKYALENNAFYKYDLTFSEDLIKNNDAAGMIFDNEYLIILDKFLSILFYDYGFIDLFFTIFHEIKHIFQNIDVASSTCQLTTIETIKDRILRKNYSSDDYYKKNYKSIIFENDAEIFSYYKTILFMFDSDIPLKILESKCDINNRFDLINKNRIRILEGNAYFFDELFDITIEDNPQFLTEYPQLSIEYILDNGKVRRRTKEELISLRENKDIDSKLVDYEGYIEYLLMKYQEKEKNPQKIYK